MRAQARVACVISRKSSCASGERIAVNEDGIGQRSSEATNQVVSR